jgi:hypothetical protein
MKKIIYPAFAVYAAMLLTTQIFAEESATLLGDRYQEQAGNFSYQPPKGWTIQEYPGAKYHIALGPTINNATPNINFVDEAFAGSLDQYVDANLNTLKQVMPNYQKVGQSDVTLDNGERAVKVVITDEQLNHKLRQIFYFTKGHAGRMVVITCTTAADLGDRFDPLFELSAKTFKLEKV